MIEFLLGLVIGILLPEGTGKFCCGCLVVIFGGSFALIALVFALAAGDQTTINRLIVGVIGVAVAWFSIALIKRITR